MEKDGANKPADTFLSQRRGFFLLPAKSRDTSDTPDTKVPIPALKPELSSSLSAYGLSWRANDASQNSATIECVLQG